MAFSGCLSLGAGIFLYGVADQLGSFLVAEQARPVMRALIAASAQEPSSEAMEESRRLADAVNAEFYAGSDIPRQWHKLSKGLHFINGKRRFVYIEREQGRRYALSGASGAFRNFLDDIAGSATAAGVIGLFVAAAGAFFISDILSKPFIGLAAAIGPGTGKGNSMPENLIARKDEAGLIAREISRYQEEVKEFAMREAHFTGDVSHELRSPLMVITGGIELLREEPRQLPAVIAGMERATRKINAAVSAMLLLARKREPEPEMMDMGSFLREIAEFIQAEGIARQCVIRIQAESEPCIRTQRDLVLVIMGNLFRNACQHGNGVVDVILRKDGLEIINGVASAGYPGTGLGISIVRRGCCKLGWHFSLTEKDSQMHAGISWQKD